MYDNNNNNNLLPPGFRFYPTEEELVDFYLRNKLNGKRELDIQRVIPVVYIYQHNPCQLPEMAGEGIRDDTEQWFFFIPIQDREARGGRPTRLTTEGYWKATGTSGYVYSSNNRIIGRKRTMVFYKGRAPNGKKTLWKMNEYKASDGEASATNSVTNLKLRHEFSLCRVYKNSKCVRAFDRRPAGFGSIEGTVPPQPLNATGNDVATPPNQNISPSNNKNLPALDVYLMESSSSVEEHARTSQPVETSNDLDFSDVPLWDWDCNFI